jgi:antitoxin ParD1/3/4
MKTTRPMGITLPTDMRALMARDRAVNDWLHTQVGSAFDALRNYPSRAVTVDQVRARLAAEHAKTR